MEKRTAEELVAAGQRTFALDRAHVFHSWSAQAKLKPLVVVGARGSFVWDHKGNRYIDFSSQLVFTNVGHQHPKVVSAIQEQAARLCTIGPHHANDQRGEAARLISELAPFGMNKVFFTNGGAEAIENAVRMARLHTGRTKILSAYRSYHGGTATAINITGDPRRWPNEAGTGGIVHFFGPFLYRSEFNSVDHAEECERSLRHLEQVVRFEGPGTIAAIVLETVPGTAGILVPPDGYLAGVREICDKYGILYVADEVMAGFGRTGTWLAIDHWDVRPDLIAFAKGVTSGYVPLGGVIVADSVAETFAHDAYPGGLTYSGHPLACAAAVATIGVMRDERMVENAANIGREVLGPGLRDLAQRHPAVGDVRGMGVFWALDLVRDQGTKEPMAPYGGSSKEMDHVVAACRDLGLLIFANFNRLHVVPPCSVTVDELKEGIGKLDRALEIADSYT